MADLTGTEKRKKAKAHMTPPLHPDVQTISRKEPQKKKKAENSSVVPSQPENAWEDSKKTYNSSMDFIENFETLVKDRESLS